jgi:alanine racemase
MAIVKASGYGSDAVKIAKCLEKNNVDYLAVAYLFEAIQLRDNGVLSPILVLHPQIGDFNKMIEYNLEPNIYSFKILDEFLKYRVQNLNHPIHIKFNTGLNRLGFLLSDIDNLTEIIISKKINVKYIFSHLGASEDLSELDFTKRQIKSFEKINNKIEKNLSRKIDKHLLNTSGILNFPKQEYNMVRSGIGLYGYGNNLMFRKYLLPIVSLISSISQIHYIEKNQSVGYNRGFVATKKTKIGIVPIGHADGIPRSLGNRKGKLLVNNIKCDIIGNVCMDMLMIDITGMDCNEGDQVVIFDEKNQTAEDFSKYSNTISYEILTSASSRIKRVYNTD